MNWFGPIMLLVVLGGLAFGLWLTRPKLSKEEKDLMLFVHQKAWKHNVRKEDIHTFLFENYEKLVLLYCKERDTFLTVNDVPRVCAVIEREYRTPPVLA